MNNLTPSEALNCIDNLIVDEKIPKGHGVKVVKWGNKWSVATSPRKSTEEHNKMFLPLLKDALTERDSPRAKKVLNELKTRNEKALSLRFKRIIQNTLSLRGNLETESEKVWSNLDYQSKDLIVRDPKLYDYSYQQREELIPLFKKNALLIHSTKALFEKERYYHANLLELSYENIPLGNYVCAAGPVYIKEHYFTIDTRGELWECVINLAPEVIINLDDSNDFLPNKSKSSYPLFEDRGKFCAVKVMTKSKRENFTSVRAYFGTKWSRLQSKKERNVVVLQYPEWFEHESTPIKLLSEMVDFTLNLTATDSPIFVMSLNGVGRAGSFIVACSLYKLHLQNALTSKTRTAIIKDLIMQGRRIRGPSFVENVTQIELLLDYADYLIDKASE